PVIGYSFVERSGSVFLSLSTNDMSKILYFGLAKMALGFVQLKATVFNCPQNSIQMSCSSLLAHQSVGSVTSSIMSMASMRYSSASTKELIDKKMEDIQQCVDHSQDVEGEYLTYLLSNTQMSLKDVYGSITELLLAGVDTTSNTLTWTLHLLSQDLQIQDRLYKEVSTFVPADRIPTAAEITRMPYLRAVIKEALRMYPVVPMNGRILSEKKIAIGGYQFSKNTAFTLCHYAISHDEDTFPEPFTFKPERWLRNGCELPNAFGSIPFGFGVRGCVGRRIAELEMYMVVFQLIRVFELKPDPMMKELKCICRTVLVPEQSVNLHFVARGYVQQLMLGEEESDPKQQQWSLSVKQKGPEHQDSEEQTEDSFEPETDNSEHD
ncbi:putative sterol 26-hydroxylase mitochondrial-like, partial [Scophthalmus maximus]